MEERKLRNKKEEDDKRLQIRRKKLMQKWEQTKKNV